MINGKLEDGTRWPLPGAEMSELAHRLRYPPPDVSPEYNAASIIEAYEQLIALPARDRGAKVRMIRAAAELRGTP